MSEIIAKLAAKRGDAALAAYLNETPEERAKRPPLAPTPGELDGVPPRAWVTAAARALTIGGAARLPTGLRSLDESTRGGLRIGKRVVVGGAPGAGKTTLLLNLCWQWALDGVLVLLLCYDEEAEDVLIRLGQMNGLERDALERGDEDARRELSELLGSVPNFHIIDADDEEVSIAEASAELASKRAPGQLSVLGVDSIQTAFVAPPISGAESDKSRVDRVMRCLKRSGKVDKHLVLATCELSRGGYRSNDARERVDDLAAFKESGGVEYGASMALVLRSVKDEDGLVDVAMPKNRMGKKLPFRLSLNFTTATLREVAKPAPDQEEAIASPMQQLKERVVSVLGKTIQPITSVDELARRLEKGKQVTGRALKELMADGRVHRQPDRAYTVLSGSGTGSEPSPAVYGSTVLSP